MTGVLNLDPDSVVFYVGGYPEDFTPPAALRYPKYRGAIKLSFVNDNPVCLFNYKHAANLGEHPFVKISQSEVSDYYDGTGYRMALTSNPQKKKRRLFRFHTNSRETNALLFYIGNEDSYFCVFMERGHLVLQGRQAGQELKSQSGEKVSLFDMQFIIAMDDKFIVNYRAKQISTNYTKAEDNITAPPLRGCVDHLTADGMYVEYNRTIGVSVGCPLSLLGVREATYNSVVSVNSLGVWDTVPVTVSLGFRSTEKHGALLRSSYQIHAQTGSTSQQCRQRLTLYGGYRLSEPHSWLSYSVPPEELNYRPHFSLEVRTRSSKGLLLYIAGKGDISLLALFMAGGKIKLSLGQNRIIHHKKKSNDGNWHRVVFSVEKNTFHLLVDGIRVTDGHLSNDAGSSLDLQNPVYLGGVPIRKLSKGHLIPKESVIGCVRDFKLNEVLVGEPVAHHGASSCFDGLSEAGTYFGGDGSHIVLDKYFTVGSDFDLAFELRPQHLTGLLFHARSPKTSFDVFLVENKVGVKVNDGNGAVSVSVMPHQSLCDGKFHAVTVSKQKEAVKVTVDSVSEQKLGPSPSTSSSATLDTLYIGGTTKRSRAPVSSSFIGCLRRVRLNGRPVAFKAASSVVGTVNISKCPAA
ncbi:laminin subunit alpha-3 [Myripristis murdjan]|uniref:laminin subunit alpha-3 n=1 Tax=Myripristis murdjan TaxID=586833 RepID=UPI001175F8C4|nr:laminin subunit alpha-3-like [Myripristis murdjan]